MNRICIAIVLFAIGATTAAAQTLSVYPTKLTQALTPDGAPANLTLTLSGGGDSSAISLSAATDSGGNWLLVPPVNVSPVNGTVRDEQPMEIAVAIDPAGLPDGTYTGAITIRGTARTNAILVPVTITIGDPGPQLPPSGIVNGASLREGPVSPGEIVTLLGAQIGPKLPYGLQVQDNVARSKIAGARVWFDGTPAPLLHASLDQVTVVVPNDVAGKASVQIQVENLVARTLPVTVAVAESAPAFFTLDSLGSGQVEAYNSDGSLNSESHPAAKGSIVVLSATGAGSMDLALPDGALVTSNELPRPMLPVEVSIGGVPAELIGAAAAPGRVPGMLQVRVRIPADAPSGPAPIVMTVGDANSPEGCTISVQ